MGGTPPLNPIDVLDLSERLRWPVEPDECLQVIGAIDDTWRELNASSVS
jgi:hypothetical protein